MTNEDIVEMTIQREGGLVENPKDPGGVTKFGITAPFLTGFLDHIATADDIRKLTIEQARSIYLRMMKRSSIDMIEPAWLRWLVFDTAVLHSEFSAIQTLQHIIHATPDGWFGPKSRAALAARDPRSVFLSLVGERMRRVGNRLRARPDQAVFAAGWADRVADFLDWYGENISQLQRP